VAEIVDHPREKTTFGGAQQEPQHTEAERAASEHHASGNKAPGDHDSRDPAPRPHASENQVTRDFTKRVANEEDPSAKAVDRRAEAEVAIHLECRKADIHSVQETYDV